MSFRVLAGSAIFLAASLGAAVSPYAQDGMQWQLSQSDGAGDALSSTLTYGVPQTDDAKVQAVCSDGTVASGDFATLTFAAEVGAKKNGESADLRFSGGGFETTIGGTVTGIGAEQGITGVTIALPSDDPLWQEFTSLGEILYMVPGYKAEALPLAEGRQAISDFLDQCGGYGNAPVAAANDAPAAEDGPPAAPVPAETPVQRQVIEDTDQAMDANPDDEIEAAEDPDVISEKEAFEAAKELGTSDAWQAFLNNFPNGFRADLARAYLRQSDQPSAAPPGPPAAEADSAPPPPQAEPTQEAPQLGTVNLGPGTSAWRNYTMETDEGNASVYAASVAAPGIEFIAYCNADKKISMLLKGVPRGAYPEFEKRVVQGLATPVGSGYDPNAGAVTLQFSNGAAVTATGYLEGMTGDLALGDPGDAQGFPPQGATIGNLMSESTVTVSAPPFATTLQLTGSRDAICAVTQKCGAAVAGCGGPSGSSSNGKPAPKPSSGCGGGKIKVEGKCMTPGQAVSYCGPGYKASGGRCVPRQSAPAPVAPKCPPGQVWSPQELCHYDD